MDGWIFDLDGTLVDSLPAIAMGLNHALASEGHPVYEEATVRSFIGDGIEMLIARALPDHPNGRTAVLERFRDWYADGWRKGTVIYPGIEYVLETLRTRGAVLAVLSNKPHRFAVEIVEALFPGVFDVVLGQREGVPHKPDPAGLRDILEHESWIAETSGMIGDSTMDLETAVRGGIASIAVTWGYHDRARLEAMKPDAIVQRPEDLLEL